MINVVFGGNYKYVSICFRMGFFVFGFSKDFKTKTLNLFRFRIFQVQGLGTALKILFNGQFETKIDEDPMNIGKNNVDRRFKLKRGEIVSLFNAFGR